MNELIFLAQVHNASFKMHSPYQNDTFYGRLMARRLLENQSQNSWIANST